MNTLTAQKSLVFLILAAFLVVGLFGLFHFAVDMNGGDSYGCPFMNIAALCALNPLGHIAIWQNTFTSTSSEEFFYTLTLLVLLVILFIFTLRNFLPNGGVSRVVSRIWKTFTLELLSGDSLQEAFSNGILHPKIF